MFLIQSPEKDIFSAADLQWKDDVAYIPSNRILQFITGEELGSGTAPTKFKIRSSRTRKPGSLPIHRIRSQCWLKYTRWDSFNMSLSLILARLNDTSRFLCSMWLNRSRVPSWLLNALVVEETKKYPSSLIVLNGTYSFHCRVAMFAWPRGS